MSFWEIQYMKLKKQEIRKVILLTPIAFSLSVWCIVSGHFPQYYQREAEHLKKRHRMQIRFTLMLFRVHNENK